MKEFLLTNWYFIVLAMLAILSFIISFVSIRKKNKSGNLLDTIKTAILENVPFWVCISEGMSEGADKKNNVISLGLALVQKMFGRKLTADESNYFVSYIGEQIEKILSAPQKKLVAVESEKKASKFVIKK